MSLSSKIYKTRDKCEVCSSSEYEILLDKDYFSSELKDFLQEYYSGKLQIELLRDMSYKIIKCKKCGFIWQSQIFNDELNYCLYNDWINPENSLKKIYNNQSYLENLFYDLLILKSFFPKIQNHKIRILDFGAGWGFFCNILKGFNFDVYALELSEKRKNFMTNNFKIKIIDFDTLNKYKFDFINSDQVFEHIEKPRETLLQLTKVLKKNGIIHISVPNGRSMEKLIRNNNLKIGKNQLHPLEHINCFTPSTIVTCAQLSNLEKTTPPLDIKILFQYPRMFLKIFLNNFFFRFRNRISVYFKRSFLNSN